MNRPGTAAALLFFPLTAILHHAVFYRPTCMLNPFGDEYTWAVVSDLLTADPSPYIGLIGAVFCYAVMRLFSWLVPYATAFFFAFVPLSIWIWDIPFSGRVICRLFHDQRGPIPLYSRYFYMLGAVLFIAAALRIATRRRSRQALPFG